jgi:hypothetical protein
MLFQTSDGAQHNTIFPTNRIRSGSWYRLRQSRGPRAETTYLSRILSVEEVPVGEPESVLLLREMDGRRGRSVHDGC